MNGDYSAFDGDHPRIRGEHLTLQSTRQTQAGSSPHTRGAPIADAMAASVTRIIPAYAGSTSPAILAGAVVLGSSPHTRGAQRLANATERIDGDHPRIRGEHKEPRDFLHTLVGIIPAYAGSTDQPLSPRSLATGSSPHTRGAPHHATFW